MEVVQSPKLLEEIKRGTERRMAFCEACGCGIGIMTQIEFEQRFVESTARCPVCGKRAVLPSTKHKADRTSLFSQRSGNI